MTNKRKYDPGQLEHQVMSELLLSLRLTKSHVAKKYNVATTHIEKAIYGRNMNSTVIPEIKSMTEQQRLICHHILAKQHIMLHDIEIKTGASMKTIIRTIALYNKYLHLTDHLYSVSVNDLRANVLAYLHLDYTREEVKQLFNINEDEMTEYLKKDISKKLMSKIENDPVVQRRLFRRYLGGHHVPEWFDDEAQRRHEKMQNQLTNQNFISERHKKQQIICEEIELLLRDYPRLNIAALAQILNESRADVTSTIKNYNIPIATTNKMSYKRYLQAQILDAYRINPDLTHEQLAKMTGLPVEEILPMVDAVSV